MTSSNCTYEGNHSLHHSQVHTTSPHLVEQKQMSNLQTRKRQSSSIASENLLIQAGVEEIFVRKAPTEGHR
jgi:hypothetical protein